MERPNVNNVYRNQHRAVTSLRGSFDKYWAQYHGKKSDDQDFKSTMRAIFGILDQDLRLSTRDSDINEPRIDRVEFSELFNQIRAALEKYLLVEESDKLSTTDVMRTKLRKLVVDSVVDYASSLAKDGNASVSESDSKISSAARKLRSELERFFKEVSKRGSERKSSQKSENDRVVQRLSKILGRKKFQSGSKEGARLFRDVGHSDEYSRMNEAISTSLLSERQGIQRGLDRLNSVLSGNPISRIQRYIATSSANVRRSLVATQVLGARISSIPRVGSSSFPAGQLSIQMHNPHNRQHIVYAITTKTHHNIFPIVDRIITKYGGFLPTIVNAKRKNIVNTVYALYMKVHKGILKAPFGVLGKFGKTLKVSIYVAKMTIMFLHELKRKLEEVFGIVIGSVRNVLRTSVRWITNMGRRTYHKVRSVISKTMRFAMNMVLHPFHTIGSMVDGLIGKNWFKALLVVTFSNRGNPYALGFVAGIIWGLVSKFIGRAIKWASDFTTDIVIPLARRHVVNPALRSINLIMEATLWIIDAVHGTIDFFNHGLGGWLKKMFNIMKGTGFTLGSMLLFLMKSMGFNPSQAFKQLITNVSVSDIFKLWMKVRTTPMLAGMSKSGVFGMTMAYFAGGMGELIGKMLKKKSETEFQLSNEITGGMENSYDVKKRMRMNLLPKMSNEDIEAVEKQFDNIEQELLEIRNLDHLLSRLSSAESDLADIKESFLESRVFKRDELSNTLDRITSSISGVQKFEDADRDQQILALRQLLALRFKTAGQIYKKFRMGHDEANIEAYRDMERGVKLDFNPHAGRTGVGMGVKALDISSEIGDLDRDIQQFNSMVAGLQSGSFGADSEIGRFILGDSSLSSQVDVVSDTTHYSTGLGSTSVTTRKVRTGSAAQAIAYRFMQRQRSEQVRQAQYSRAREIGRQVAYTAANSEFGGTTIQFDVGDIGGDVGDIRKMVTSMFEGAVNQREWKKRYAELVDMTKKYDAYTRDAMLRQVRDFAESAGVSLADEPPIGDTDGISDGVGSFQDYGGQSAGTVEQSLDELIEELKQ